MKKAPKRLGLGDLLGMKYYPLTWGLYISINHGLRIPIKQPGFHGKDLKFFFVAELSLDEQDQWFSWHISLATARSPTICVSGGWVAFYPPQIHHGTMLLKKRNGFQRKEQVKIKKSTTNKQVSGSQTLPLQKQDRVIISILSQQTLLTPNWQFPTAMTTVGLLPRR